MKLAAETFISIELYVLASAIIPHIKKRCSDKWLNKSETETNIGYQNYSFENPVSMR